MALEIVVGLRGCDSGFNQVVTIDWDMAVSDHPCENNVLLILNITTCQFVISVWIFLMVSSR